MTRRLEPAAFFLLRTPAFAASRWASTAASDASPSALGQFVDDPDVDAALRLASTSLHSAVARWRAEGRPGAPPPELAASLVDHVARMTLRPVPFGLFAAQAVGRLGERGEATSLVLAPRRAWKRRTRLDTMSLRLLYERALAMPEVRDRVRFLANPTIWRDGTFVRFVVPPPIGGAPRDAAVLDDEALGTILARARSGATLAELAAALPDVGDDDARAYVESLVAEQLLVPALAPAVTADDPLAVLVSDLAGIPEAAALRDAADELAGALRAVDEGATASGSAGLASALHRLSAGDARAEQLQASLVVAGELTLGRDVAEALAEAVDALARITPPRGGDPLAAWRSRFADRFGRAFVPLLEALDAERGVPFGGVGPSHDAPPPGWLLRRVDALHAAGGGELVLGRDDRERLATGARPPPFGVAAVATIASLAPRAIWLHRVLGATAGELLGRHAADDATGAARAALATLAADEERRFPELVFAEIVHLPQDRGANIVLRPRVRAHEIPCLGRSSVPGEAQLALAELLVGVVDDAVVLFAPRLGKRVVPARFDAHNPDKRNGVPVYRFLCHVGDQLASPLPAWRWSPTLREKAWLPRVRIDDVIVAPARFRLDRDELDAVDVAQVRAVLAARGAPRELSVVDPDGRLPVDLDVPASLHRVLRAVAKDGFAIVEERPSPASSPVSGEGGRFAHEIVVPLRSREAPRVPDVPAAARAIATGVSVRRAYGPGSCWLYAKVYSGRATLEHVLATTLAPLARDAVLAGDAELWFFVRAEDPDPHLRVRLRGRPASLAKVRRALDKRFDALVRERLLARVQYDTYLPELERYGGPEGMPLVEAMFWADTEASVDLLAAYEERSLAEREAACLASLVDLLDVLVPGEAAVGVAAEARDRFFASEAVPPDERQALGDRWRRERRVREALVAAARRGEAPFAPLVRRRERLAAVLEGLAPLFARGLVDRAELARSLLHMHANRMLRGPSRAVEVVLYDQLFRVQDSQHARARRTTR